MSIEVIEGISENMTFEGSSSAEELRKYAEQGYVFHGSPDPTIEILEPRPATSTDESDTFSNDTAVFATLVPSSAVIFAVMSVAGIPDNIIKGQSWSVGMGKEGRIVAKIPANWKHYILKNCGKVYVLSNDAFEDPVGWQTKSRSNVKPYDAIDVVFQDYLSLGGEVVWK